MQRGMQRGMLGAEAREKGFSFFFGQRLLSREIITVSTLASVFSFLEGGERAEGGGAGGSNHGQLDFFNAAMVSAVARRTVFYLPEKKIKLMQMIFFKLKD